MARIADGSFYIQRSNQDFWLRENGVWIRKGNIRDEGSSGIVSVSSVTALGYDMNAQVTRTRFVGSVLEDLGLTMAAVVDQTRAIAATHGLGFALSATVARIKAIAVAESYGMNMNAVVTNVAAEVESIAVAMDLGLDMHAAIELSKLVSASVNAGFIMDAVLLDRIRPIAAAKDYGFLQAAAVQRIKDLAATEDYGFTQAASIDRIKAIAAAKTYGFLQSAALELTQELGAANSFGFLQAAVVQRIRLVAAAMDYGYSMTAALSLIKSVSSSQAYGFSLAAAVERTRLLTSAESYGYSQATSLTHAVPALPKFLVIGLSASPWVLWYDSSVAAISAPATGPTATVKAIAFSPDGSLCVIATASTIYRYDTSTTTPSYLGALSSPPSWAHIEDISFNDAGTRMMVIDSQLSPYYWIYNTSTWATVTAPTGVAGSLQASWDDTSGKLVIAQGSTTLKLIDTSGMTASATQPGTQPSVGAWLAAEFDPSGTYFVGYAAANPSAMKVWKMSALSAPLSNPGTMPHINSSTLGRAVAWNPAGTKFALCEDFGTSIYNVSGTTITLDTTINYNVIAGGQPVFRKDGAKLFLTQRGSTPRFAIYTVSGWTKDTNPATQPASDPSAMASSI